MQRRAIPTSPYPDLVRKQIDMRLAWVHRQQPSPAMRIPHLCCIYRRLRERDAERWCHIALRLHQRGRRAAACGTFFLPTIGEGPRRRGVNDACRSLHAVTSSHNYRRAL